MLDQIYDYFEKIMSNSAFTLIYILMVYILIYILIYTFNI